MNSYNETDVESFTYQQFKLLFSPPTEFKALQQFNQASQTIAEDDASSNDIVKAYCADRKDANDIISLLEQDTCKPTQIKHVFRALECILLRVADDLHMYGGFGQGIVKAVLENHSKILVAQMTFSHRFSEIKTVFKLLTAMAMLGFKSANMVITHIDISQSAVIKCLNHRLIQDKDDVRACVVKLIVALLLSGDSAVTRVLVEQRTFFCEMFKSMYSDRLSTIQLILTALKDKVLKSGAISKTSKLRLFSEKVLCDLAKLYNWKGPRGWKPSAINRSSKKTDKQEPISLPEDEEDEEEDREAVAEIAHSFLLELCCSINHGIIFLDRSYGLGNRRENQLLNAFLATLSQSVFDRRLKQDLVVKALQACPDQIQCFLKNISSTLVPRPSRSWMAAMQFLHKIYQAQPEIPPPLTVRGHVTSASLVAMVNVFILPPSLIFDTLLNSIKSDSMTVRHTLLEMIAAVLRRVQIIQDYCVAQRVDLLEEKLLTDVEYKEFIQLFKEAIYKLLPSVTRIMECWSRATSPSQAVDEGDQSKPDVQSVSVPSLPEHLVTISKVLCLYNTVLTGVMPENAIDLSALLEGVRLIQTQKGVDDESDDKLVAGVEPDIDEHAPLLQLYLLKLLSVTDVRRLNWTKQSHGHSLVYLLLEMAGAGSRSSKLQHFTRELLYKLFLKTGLFDFCPEELTLWLHQLEQCAVDERSTALKLLSQILTTYFSNPYPYIDKVTDVITEVVSMSVMGDAMETASTSTADALLDSITLLDEEDLTCLHGASNSDATDAVLDTPKFPFTPLASVLVELLHKADNEETVPLKYICSVLLDVLHAQHDATAFCLLIYNARSVLQNCPALPYLLSWLPDSMQEEQVISRKLLKSVKRGSQATKVSLQVMKLHLDLSSWLDDESSMTALESQIGHSEASELISLTKQILLCMNSVINTYDKTPKKCGKAIKYYFRLLLCLCNQQPSTGDNSIQTELNIAKDEAEIDILAMSPEKVSSMKIKVIEVILSNATLFSHFLGSSVLSKGDISEYFNDFISKELATLIGSIQVDEGTGKAEIKRILIPYFIKVESFLELRRSDVDVSKNKGFLLFVVLCKAYLPNTLIQKIAEFFLQSGNAATKLVAKSHDSECHSILSDSGELVLSLLNMWMVQTGNTTKHLSPVTIQELFRLLMIVPCDNTNGCCLKLLKENPSHSLAVTSDMFSTLLLNVFKFNMEVMQMLICYNPSLRGMFSDWAQSLTWNKDVLIAHSPLLIVYLRLLRALDETSKLELALHVYWKHLMPWLKDVHKEEDPPDCNRYLEAMVILLLERQDDKPLLKLYTTLLDQITTNCDQSLFSIHQIRILKTLAYQFCNLEDKPMSEFRHVSSLPKQVAISQSKELLTSNEPMEIPERNLLPGFLVCLIKCLACILRKKKRDTELETCLLEMLHNVLNENQSLTISSDAVQSFWASFVKFGLRHYYTDARLMILLSCLVPNLYPDNNTLDPSLFFLHNMLTSHSLFLPVLLREEGTVETKNGLIDLLLIISRQCPSVCQASHINAFLSAYSASLRDTDQRLLLLMQCYETNGIFFKDLQPYYWGEDAVDAAPSQKAEGSNTLGQTAVKSAQIMQSLQADRMTKTISRFPNNRKLVNHGVEKFSAEEQDCYDPVFLLAWMSQLLSAEHTLHFKQFVESHCLSYLFAALSSEDTDLRRAAYHSLAIFYKRVESAHFQEKDHALYIIEFLANSIQAGNVRLPGTISLYLARVSSLFPTPDSPVFRVLHNFLVLKPQLDLTSVPDFYRMFNSTSLQHKEERVWLLELLADSMRDSTDYKILERHMKLLQTFYDGSLSDPQTQVLVLKTVKALCGVKTACQSLLKKYGILSWLATAVKDGKLSSSVQLSLWTEIIYSLWCSVLEQEKDDPIIIHSVHQNLFCALSSLLAAYRTPVPVETLNLFLKTFLSILHWRPESHGHDILQGDHMNASSTDLTDNTMTTHVCPSGAISLQDVVRLIDHFYSLGGDEDAINASNKLRVSLGISSFKASAQRPASIHSKKAFRNSRETVPAGKRYQKISKKKPEIDDDTVDGESVEDDENENEDSAMVDQKDTSVIVKDEIKICNKDVIEVLMSWTPASDSSLRIVSAKNKLHCRNYVTAGLMAVDLCIKYIDTSNICLLNKVLSWVRGIIGAYTNNPVCNGIITYLTLETDVSCNILTGLLQRYTALYRYVSFSDTGGSLKEMNIRVSLNLISEVFDVLLTAMKWCGCSQHNVNLLVKRLMVYADEKGTDEETKALVLRKLLYGIPPEAAQEVQQRSPRKKRKSSSHTPLLSDSPRKKRLKHEAC